MKICDDIDFISHPTDFVSFLAPVISFYHPKSTFLTLRKSNSLLSKMQAPGPSVPWDLESIIQCSALWTACGIFAPKLH
jgi:hypothetical protein